MDADLQDSPEEIPALYNRIKEDNFDLVSGWKQKRYDNAFTKNIPSKLYNWTNRKISGIKLHDMNCGLKAYKNVVIKSVEVQGEMHRYIPVLAKAAGFPNIGEQVVQHQARKYGVSKFGLERFLNGFLDLFTVTFVSRFGKKPMHFFGGLGVIMFLIGFLLTFWLGVNKLFIDQQGIKITSRPEFYLALVVMMIGTQFFLSGFIAELLIRTKTNKGTYQIESILENENTI